MDGCPRWTWVRSRGLHATGVSRGDTLVVSCRAWISMSVSSWLATVTRRVPQKSRGADPDALFVRPYSTNVAVPALRTGRLRVVAAIHCSRRAISRRR